MNREPLGLYLLRLLMGIGLFGFMLMLYWSSVLIEEDVKGVRSQLRGMANEISEIKSIQEKILSEGVRTTQKMSKKERSIKKRSQMDPSLPNLLTEDPFYAETLPKMLGPDFRAAGTFRDSTIGKPEDLHPFNNWSTVQGWRGLCSVSVSQLEFGKYNTMAPNMALKMEERVGEDGRKEYWIHLRDDLFWQPLSEQLFSEDINLAPHFFVKHPVTAHDYKFYFDAMMNPHNQESSAVSLRNYYADLEGINVIDDFTFSVRWKVKEFEEDGKTVERGKFVAKSLTGSLSPLASFVYKYFADGTKIIEDDSDQESYRTNSVWAQNFMEHWAKNIIVSCGPWIFEGMSDQQIKFRRNPDYYFPLGALALKIETEFKNSPDSIWQDFKTNRIDSHVLLPDQLIELDDFLQSPLYQEQKEKKQAIKRLDYVSRAYAYIGWNQAKPYFKTEMVRRALTMAIDRERIIKKNLNGMGIEITGPFYVFSPSYNNSIKPWPFDPQAARSLLEEDGWYDSDGDGIIDKEIEGERVPFQFTLTYYVKNPMTKTNCEYIATALKEVGISCQLNGVDMADLSAAMEEKSFDAIYMGWGLGTPPEDPRQLWHSDGATQPGSSNSVGFVNKEADQIIEKLTYEDNLETRISLYHRFHEIIHEEQPYTFLYTPKTALLYREYLENVFIPAERQDLIPGANIGEPSSSIFWLNK